MKVAIVGTRYAYNLSEELISAYLPKECNEIISGGSGKVDLLAQNLAKHKNVKFTCFFPEYEIYGKKAPLVRNIKIIEYSDMILAFWNNDSHGTRFVIKESLQRGKPVQIIHVDS